MAQKVVNKALGLYSFKNNLTVPDGAMAKADNVVIDRDGIIEPRRGFGLHSDFGLSSDRAKQLLQYKDRLLVHYGTTLMYEEANGSFTAFDGTYSELESGLRIKGIENSGNYYFTTSEGVKKISATSSSDFSSAADYITDAGAVRALGFEASLDYSNGGWLQADNGAAPPVETGSIVSYIVMWGYKDKNSNLILGAPSESVTVINQSISPANVNLKITIPSEIPVSNPLSYFVQTYRSSIKSYDSKLETAADTERKLVSEVIVTTDNRDTPDNSTITIVDDLSESFRVTAPSAYTNEVSGEGILQANTRPPRCKDIEYFKGSTFYSNTSTRHSKNLLYATTDNLVSGVSRLIIAAESGTPIEYTYVGVQQNTRIQITGHVWTTPSEWATTTLSIKAGDTEAYYMFWFDTTGSDTAPVNIGKIPVRVDISGAANNNDFIDILEAVIDEPTNNLADYEFEVTLKSAGNYLYIQNTRSGKSAIESENLPVSTTFIDITVGDGEDISNKQILLPKGSETTPGIRITDIAKSTARVISGNPDEIVTAIYTSSESGIQGEVNLESKTAGDDSFLLALNEAAALTDFTPVLPLEVTTSSNNADINAPTNVLTVNHGLALGYSVGDLVRIYNRTGTLGVQVEGYHSITVVDPGVSFSVNLPNAVSTSETGDVTFFKMSVISENEVNPNRIYYSKSGIPEAVPTLDYYDVGAKDKAIDRIVALRDSLFILKQDGIYRLSGADPSNFNVVLFDNSTPIIAADSAAILNNKIYSLTTQGVAEISDSGVSIVSRNIEDLILDPTSNNFPSFSTQCFGMSSENDRAYFLHLPADPSDITATQCFRYNVFTSAWTRWDIAKNCGIVKDADDKIYFGASDINYIEQERKNFKRSDYADRQSSNNINAQITDTTMEMSTVAGIEKFDAIYQEQYITVARFNRLLSTLDTDPNLVYGGTGNSYTEQFGASIGADLSTLLSALITQVQADDLSSQVYSPSSGTNDKDTLRDDFNQFTLELNTSDGVFLLSYPTFTSLVKYEDIVADVTAIGNIVTFTVATPFVVGVVTVYKAIPTSIEYVPENLGDTSLMKHFREATMMFNNYAFTFGEMGFRSDVSASLELQLFLGDGNGDYGTPGYGDAIYGGASNSRPFRTYIPRNKQRCRFIVIAFNHDAARESFEITGYSVTYNESTTERAYKD